MAIKKLSIFEKYLTLWVLLCIAAGIILGKFAPGVALKLDNFAVYHVSIPIAICLFFMMYPIFIQTILIFLLGYGLSRLLGLSYENAAPASMIGASNHFEVAIATATMLFGLSSGASLATVVGVLIEVPVMLMLVSVCRKTCHIFRECCLDLPQCKTRHLPAGSGAIV